MKRAMCAVFVAIFLFSSCTVLDRKPSIYYNEDELSLDEITEMRHSFETPDESHSELNLVPYRDGEIEAPVYWNKNSKVWHLNAKCGYLNSEGEIIFGSIDDAVINGKTKVCSLCDKKK